MTTPCAAHWPKRLPQPAPRTRADYDRVLAHIDDRLGGHDTGQVRRHHVVAWRDQNIGRFADYLVQVLRVLFEHAIDMGWRDDNPARGVQTVYRPSGRRKAQIYGIGRLRVPHANFSAMHASHGHSAMLYW